MRKILPPLLALAAAGLMLATTLFGVYAYDESWRTTKLAHLGDLASAQAQSLERQIATTTSSAYILGSLVRHDPGVISEFPSHADDILRSIPGITNLQLAPNGIIEQIHPLPGHEKALGHNILRDDRRSKEAWLAVTTKQMTLAGPFELVQGGIAIIARFPVYLPESAPGQERFWGFTSALIYLEELLRNSEMSNLTKRGYHYQLSRKHPDSGEIETFAQSSDAPLHNSLSRELRVPNQVWTLTLGLPSPLGHSPLYLIQLLSSLITTALTGWLVYRLLKQPALLRDLVRRKTALLNQERGRSQQYLDMVNTLVLVLDESGKIRLLNRRGYEVLGYRQGTLTGQDWFSTCLPEDHQAAARGALHEALSGRSCQESYRETPVLTAEGEEKLIAWNDVTVRELDGGHRLLCAGQDITEHKRAESSLSKLSSAVEQSSTLVVIISREGLIEYVNPYFVTTTGYAPEEVLGRNPRVLHAPQTPRKTLIGIWRSLSRGLNWKGEMQYRKCTGQTFWVKESISPIKNSQGEITHFVSVSEDITDQRQHLKLVEHLAYYDQLTHLPNRRLFMMRLKERMTTLDRHDRSLYLIYLDLNQLKTINEILGHEMGDQLLRKVADKLLALVRPEDLLSRIGGDEFSIILTRSSQPEVQVLAKRIIEALRLPFALNGTQRHQGHEMLVTASMGIASAPRDTTDPTELLKFADMAMYQAKKLGRNNFHFFSNALVRKAQQNHFLEVELRRAIFDDEFVIYYQPQIDLSTRRVVGLEALIRWNHHSKGLIFPDQFIGLAEETGLIVAIGKEVIRKACLTYNHLKHEGYGDLKIAINLSALQFRDPLFVDSFRNLLAENRVPATQIELELTESMLMEDIEDAIQILGELKGLGVSLAIDDFGTGYSSLSYLKQLPVDLLKVDRSFVKDIPEDSNDMAITTAVIAMAHKLSLEVVAEGVETPAQLAFLEDQACEMVQGYLFSPPVPETQLVPLIADLDIQLKRDAGAGVEEEGCEERDLTPIC